MPTTSNFGWTTPADTDLVKDGAAAIRTLGNGIDTSFLDLKGGSTDQVLAKNSNTDLDFKWVAQDDSNAIQNALLTTTGDTIYASAASTPARLGIGSTGQVLTVTGGVPAWATPAGGGKVLQVVQGTSTTATTIASTSFTDTGLSASITPSSASSKVLVLITQQVSLFRNENFIASGLKVVRGATDIVTRNSPDAFGVSTSAANPRLRGVYAVSYLDTPATTSATTYKTQARVDNTDASGELVCQASSALSSIVLMEIGA